MYVTEAGNHRVSVFEPDGTFIRHVGSFGDEPGQFLLPFEVMTDAVGDVYVMDDLHQSFSKFDASGAFAWRSDPRVDPDLSGHFHRGAADAEGRMWLTNDDTDLVMAFDERGRVVDAFDVRAEADQFVEDRFGPCGLALDDAGNAFVIECFTRAIAVFDPQHRLIGAWAEADGLPFGSAYAFGPDRRLYATAGGYRGQAVASPDEIPRHAGLGFGPCLGWTDTEPSEHSLMAA